MPYAKARDGCMLYYKDWGRGRARRPAARLAADRRHVRRRGDRLVEAGHRCIIPDRRGFGRSDQPWDGYDYDTLADDVAAVLDDAGIQEPRLARRLLDGRRRSRPLPHPAGQATASSRPC